MVGKVRLGSGSKAKIRVQGRSKYAVQLPPNCYSIGMGHVILEILYKACDQGHCKPRNLSQLELDQHSSD